MDGTVDGVTRWRRVADGIRAAIGDGSVIDRLPTEAELAARFGVNRHTVRRAIAALAADGLVKAERGRGTFVSGALPRLAYEVGLRTRFGDNVLAQSRRPRGLLLRSEVEAADARLAGLLDIGSGDRLTRLETLHDADGLPLSVATHWFPAAPFPRIGEDLAETGSITEALRRAGVADYRRRETRITAERASREDADHLGAAPDALLLVARAVDVDMRGRPIQAMRTRFHAERTELVVRH
jgi:GntR family transcriptional regulator, phosphonate transport system regulatory protein